MVEGKAADLRAGQAEPALANQLVARAASRQVVALLDGVPLSTLGVCPSRRAVGLDPELVERALGAGISVFAVTPQNGQGRHEDELGQILATCFDRRTVARGAVTIISHVGFLAESIRRFGVMRSHIERDLVGPGLMTWDDLARGLHSMAPGFVRHSLAMSRRRLGLATIDGMLLERPEVQLAQVSSAEFDRRLSRAFEALERAWQDGWIRWYGVATASLDPARLIAVARDVAGERHHLRALEVGVSPGNPVAATARNLARPAGAVSLLQAASDAGLYVFATGCLDGGGMEYDLPSDSRRYLGAVMTDRQLALQWVRGLRAVGTSLVPVRRTLQLEENLHVLTMVRPREEAVVEMV